MENFAAIAGVLILIAAIMLMTRSGRVALGLFNIRLGVLMYRLGLFALLVVIAVAAFGEAIAPHLE